jgi:hypothetical protein
VVAGEGEEGGGGGGWESPIFTEFWKSLLSHNKKPVRFLGTISWREVKSYVKNAFVTEYGKRWMGSVTPNLDNADY